MLVVRIQGGLGNQICQYLLALELREKYPDAEVGIDLNCYRRCHPHNGYELEKWVDMDPAIRVITRKEYHRVTGKLHYIGSRRVLASSTPFARFLRKAIGGVERCIEAYNKHVGDGPNEIFQEYVPGYPQADLENIGPNDDRYFNGTWFNQRFSDTVLHERFRFLEVDDPAFIALSQKMAQENAVSIHIRHGDYSAWGYETLSEEYYRKAIALVNERVDQPSFYLFSDDPSYAKDVIAPLCGDKVTVVEQAKKSNACLDLQLMSRCSHHIIANSTFSMVARLLSGGEGLLVAPRTWIHGNTTWEMPGCEYIEV